MTTTALPPDPSVQKLVNMLGLERATSLYQRTLADIRAPNLANPQDRLRFGVALMKQGGVVEAIGRSIKIQAILMGAKEE